MGVLMGASACAYIRLRTLRTASYMLFASFRAPRCTAYVTVTCQDLLPEICFTVYDFRDLAKHFCGTEASKQEKTMWIQNQKNVIAFRLFRNLFIYIYFKPWNTKLCSRTCLCCILLPLALCSFQEEGKRLLLNFVGLYCREESTMITTESFKRQLKKFSAWQHYVPEAATLQPTFLSNDCLQEQSSSYSDFKHHC